MSSYGAWVGVWWSWSRRWWLGFGAFRMKSSVAVRIAYYIASGRRIILLTVFSKQHRRERAEVARAERAMRRCITEGHTAEDDAND